MRPVVAPLLSILALWRAQAAWLAAGLLVSLAALAAGVAVMAKSGALIAAGVLAGALTGAALLRALGAARVVLRYLERLLTHAATFRALADLRVWFFRGLSRSAAGGLGFRRAGDVLARLVGDVEALDGLYLRILVPLAGAVLLLPVLLLVVGARAPALAGVVGALFVCAAFVLPALAARGTLGSGARLAQAASGLRVAALDTLTGLREVRAFGAQGRMLARVQARESELLAAQHEAAHRTALAGAASFLAAQAALLAILVAAHAEPAASVVALFLTTAAFEAVGGLPRAGALAGHAAAAAGRVLSAAREAPAVPDPATARVPAVRAPASLAFQAVRFGYGPDRPVLDGLTLEVPAGARVAVLGPSGAGKSTLAALALKMAAPQSGRVLLAGVDLADMAAADARARIAWLSQATHLFDDTIRANLLLARPDADDAALWAALEAARIADLVRALPDGLESWVGESGARFSGGQARRLVLARALLSAAPVLILDEPCAGLDAETEREFFLTLNDTAPGRTIVLIAHRLTGVERLDRVWRISGGKAVAATA